jgi:hypothetical protein
MPLAIEKRISASALSSKMNRRLVWQKAMRIKQDLPSYKPSIYLRTEISPPLRIVKVTAYSYCYKKRKRKSEQYTKTACSIGK